MLSLHSNDLSNVDLHMHTTVSDGTDTPEELLEKIRKTGLKMFSVTDHDAIKGSLAVLQMLREDDPAFITGVEFSCKDEDGKYHILGYDYQPDADAIHDLVETGHQYRMNKVRGRLECLAREYNIVFPQVEIDQLLAMDNPGKPHIGNLMVKCGYAATKDEAIEKYVNQIHYRSQYLRPEEAIQGILASGGIPVLAHPVFGSGREMIRGEEMEKRVQKLISFGLKGVEAYYSKFTADMQEEMLGLATKYDLLITAGSDYHGRNKTVKMGETGFLH